MRSRTPIVAAIVTGVLLIGGALVAASVLSSGGGASGSAAPVLAGAEETRALLAGIPQDGAVLGDPDAPVTLVEYADMQCPYCARWAADAFPDLVREYVRPGKVKLEFRGLAFLGPESDKALRAAVAAGMQDRLWHFVELLFRNQGPENGGWVTDELLQAVGAGIAGLDAGQMLSQADDDEVTRAIRAADEAAEQDAIPGTPAFLAGPSGGDLHRIEISSFGLDGIRPALDALLRR